MPQDRILIVDDDPSVLAAAAGALRDLGYIVAVADSAQDAMAIVSRESFDLVMVGDTVPDLDAAALVQQARCLNPNASAVTMTNRASAATGLRPASAASRLVLAKPFDTDDLKATVSQALEKRDVTTEGLRLRTLMPLFEVSSALMSEVKLDRLFDLIVDIVKRETNADRVSLMVLDESTQQLSIEAAVGLPGDIVSSTRAVVGQGIAGSVAQSGEALLLNGAVDHAWAEQGEPITSAICVPLKVKGRVIGVLNSSNIVREGSFSRSDLDMMTILAGQAAIAIENARLFEELAAKQAALEQLLGELLRAQEEERQRISTEIHDSVAQLMVSASYHTQSSSALLAQSKFDRAREEAEFATKIIGKCVKELRGIVTELYPPALSELGLLGALQENVEYFRRETGVACRIVSTTLPEQLSPVQEMVIYRVVQEALNNVLKHAQATEAQISLDTNDGEITVEISDNGKGFDAAGAGRTKPQYGRVGLLNMRSRAQMLGGNLNIEARPGGGTKVILTIPRASPDNLSRNSQPSVKGGSG
ncbi:MAG: GAF domain-containing protein [Dehalococcoidia bacterium]|nr:GAF domain-containing protein [Dehalococcoidia bacterium]